MPSYKDYSNFHAPYDEDEIEHINGAIDPPEGGVIGRHVRKGNYLVPQEGYDDLTTFIPSVGAHLLIAKSRVEEQFDNLDKNGAYPEGLNDIVGFEGIDPVGHFTRKHLECTQRIQNLKQFAATASPAVRAAIQSCLDQFEINDTKASEQYNNFTSECYTRRHQARIAKVVQSEIAYEVYANDAENDNVGHAKDMDDTLKGLEYIAGLSTVPLNEIQTKRMETHFSLSPTEIDLLHAQRFDRAPHDRTISIPFSNFDHILTQQYLAHPSNWGKSPKDVPNDWKNAEVAEEYLKSYASNCVANTINSMYSGVESLYPSTYENTRVDRAKLITVDGKTVDQVMKERYAELSNPPTEQEQWMKENMVKMTAEIVSSALMAGKRVEAFLTGDDGKIKGNPIALQKTGYEPTPLKPVTFSRWEKFCIPFGGYKQKIADQAEYLKKVEERYEEEQRVIAAREVVMAQNKEASDLLVVEYDQFKAGKGVEIVKVEAVLAEKEKISIENDLDRLKYYQDKSERYSEINCSNNDVRLTFMSSYKELDPELKAVHVSGVLGYGRGNLTSSCCCALMATGNYSIDDVMDPTKLLSEKAEFGKQYLTLSASTDPDELEKGKEIIGGWIYEGHKQIVAALDQKLAGKSIENLVDDPEFELLSAAAHLAFDASQNKNHLKEGYYGSAAKDFETNIEMQNKLKSHPDFKDYQAGSPLNEEQRKACGEYYDTPVNNLASALECLRGTVVSRSNTTIPSGEMTRITAAELKGVGMQQELITRREKNPDKPFSELVGFQESVPYHAMLISSQVEFNEINLSQKDGEQFMRNLRNGDLAEKFKGVAAKGINNPLLMQEATKTMAEYHVTSRLHLGLRNESARLATEVPQIQAKNLQNQAVPAQQEEQKKQPTQRKGPAM